jgi:hypothetical protein
MAATLSVTDAGIFLAVATGLEGLALLLLLRKAWREQDEGIVLLTCVSFIFGLAGTLGALWAPVNLTTSCPRGGS